MTVDLEGLMIAVLGGDRRELQVLEALSRAGADVRAVGFRSLPEVAAVRMDTDPVTAARGARVILGPMGGTDQEGRIHARLDGGPPLMLDDAVFGVMAPHGVVLIGATPPSVREAATTYGIRMVDIAANDEIAILNSIPTAEGAIQLAMERLPVTLHGSRAVVVGFGRCGMTLGRVLAGLGALVTIAVRDGAARARAVEMGLAVCAIRDLPEAVTDADVIFNTVPALVITKDVLERTRPDVLVIDLASQPGGSDFEAAESLGRTALLALGLPGKVAPVTAGRILASALPSLIRSELAMSER